MTGILCCHDVTRKIRTKKMIKSVRKSGYLWVGSKKKVKRQD